jgi:hypothetical protein
MLATRMVMAIGRLLGLDFIIFIGKMGIKPRRSRAALYYINVPSYATCYDKKDKI